MFNTPDGAEILGVNSDREYGLAKAKKGTPEYDKWLEAYRAKRAGKNPSSEEGEKAKKVLSGEKQKQVHTSDITEKLDFKNAIEEAKEKGNSEREAEIAGKNVKVKFEKQSWGVSLSAEVNGNRIHIPVDHAETRAKHIAKYLNSGSTETASEKWAKMTENQANSGTKGRDTRFKHAEETFKSLENGDPSTLNQMSYSEKRKVQSALDRKIKTLSESFEASNGGVEKFKFFGKEYTLSCEVEPATLSVAKPASGASKYEVVRANTVYTLSDGSGKKISSFTAKQEWYPSHNNAVKEKEGKKIFTSPSSNTSSKFFQALENSITSGEGSAGFKSE